MDTQKTNKCLSVSGYKNKHALYIGTDKNKFLGINNSPNAFTSHLIYFPR